jgi:hypothetical protein
LKLQHPPLDFSADPERGPVQGDTARRLLAGALAADRLALECAGKLADALQQLGRENVAETCTNLGGLLAERIERIAARLGKEEKEQAGDVVAGEPVPVVDAPWPLRASTYRILRAARTREQTRLLFFLRKAGRSGDDNEREAAEWLAAQSLNAVAYLRLLAIRALGTSEGRNDDLARSLAARLEEVDELRAILDEQRINWTGLTQRYLALAADNAEPAVMAAIGQVQAQLAAIPGDRPEGNAAGNSLKGVLVELCRSVAWTEELCELTITRTRDEEIMLLAQEGEVECGALMEALTGVADAMGLPTALSC